MSQTTLIVIIIDCLFVTIEAILLEMFKSRLEGPIAQHTKSWNQVRGRNKKKIKNYRFHQTYYAYNQIETQELKEIRILLKSYDTETTYFQIAVDLFVKFILPVGTFILGVFVSTTNNFLSIQSKNGSASLSDESSINELFSSIFVSFAPIAVIVTSLFLLSIVQNWCKHYRKKRITQHLLIIDQILEDRED
ncbi:hypothetical protein [Paenibacillus tyrfis]|uniref:MotA/TolQ/ExbB proton channel domain-containing protein n=1 Tax=Paenibacillus tyrfis TaxID=1501230 RepID=A0A081NXP0_9BACL|nr:hypothetical protein [Paenibacillus tyrfis]KEQ23213.1 hypothetical protein ET33_17815 [Paenibacillus tyrfis]